MEELFFVVLLFVIQSAYWLAVYTGFMRVVKLSGDGVRHHYGTGGDTGTSGGKPITAPSKHEPVPLSVIIAARNEATTLPTLLDALQRQTHAQYEVVVIDDASTDATASVVREWARTHAYVRIVQVKNPQQPRKKHALTRGIAAAQYEHLAFTDADCAPGPEWLATMASCHEHEGADVVVTGYSPFRRNGSVLGAIASYETFVTGVLTTAAAGLERPYMAVGRSISYSRSLFRRVGGYAVETLSGDDDLFVQAAAKLPGVVVAHPLEPQSFVATDPPSSWREWLRQKRRHTSAGRLYSPRVKLHLGLFHATNILLWTAPLWAGLAGFTLLVVKLAVESAILHHAAGALREPVRLLALPALEFSYAAYNLILAPLGLAKAPERW